MRKDEGQDLPSSPEGVLVIAAREAGHERQVPLASLELASMVTPIGFTHRAAG